MGLDITAYRNAKPARAEVQAVIATSKEPQDLAYDMGVTIPYINPDFPGREEGIAPGVAYETDDVKVCVGMSYGGYNVWRETLASMVGITSIREWFRNPDMSAPFAELINFADNEGTIGPVTCKRIAADFDAWAERAANFIPTATPTRRIGDVMDARWYREMYKRYHEAFSHAAQDGFVEFH